MNKTYNVQNYLGEGPIWHEKRGSIFWTDIEKRQLFELNIANDQIQIKEFDSRIGTIVIDQNDNLILAMQGKIVRYDLSTGIWEILCEIETEIPNNRPNDGKVGPDGRLWQGTMDVTCANGAGSLYSIDEHFSIEKKLTSLTVANGLAWSHDYTSFYHIDSPTYQVKKYKFDIRNGDIFFENVAVTIPTELGQPDGMAIDEEGMLWVAIWGGFCVNRYNPDTGNLLETINLPAPQISSCAFGGPNLDLLFITSAQENMIADELQKYPESGNLFVRKMKVKGTLPFKFGVKYF
jgi:sugar lactone lactonase YvrE